MSNTLPLLDNISIYEGDDATLTFSCLSDITGYKVELSAELGNDSPYTILKAVGYVNTTDPTKYVIPIRRSDTTGKGRTEPYPYSIKLTSPTGSVRTDRYGTLTIIPNAGGDGDSSSTSGDYRDIIETDGLTDNAILKWDASTKMLKASGVTSEEQGDLTTATNSVNIGVHDVGSAGRNIAITNRVDKRTFNPIFQEVGIDDANTTTAYQREHEAMSELEVNTVTPPNDYVVLTNPTWNFSTAFNETVFGIQLHPVTNMVDVIYTIKENGVPIYTANIGNFRSANPPSFAFFETPFSLYANKSYTVTLTCKDGSDAMFYGNLVGKPHYTVKLRKFDFKELASKDYVDSKRVTPTMASHFVGIFDDLQGLHDAVPTPTQGLQAIVINPSEYYYHYVGSAWAQLAPVGSFHPTYLGAYDTVQDLQTANPSPTKDALAIVGVDAKAFYFYDGLSWKMVTHTDIPALDRRVSDVETKSTDNTNRITTAENHLQTLQTDATTQDNKISALEVGQKTLQSNIDQKLDGLHIEDTSGNAFDDVVGLTFEGATVSDDGSDHIHVTVAPKITVANGQAPDSTSESGNALIFDGSTITVDPHDANVIHVDIPTSTNNGISVGDGATASRQVHRLLFNGHEVHGSGDTAEVHLEFVHFKTLTERDTWSTKYGTHLDYDVIALVDADENGFVQFYKFDATTKAWTEYNAQGVVMSDSDGAIPKNIKTVVFGPGFAIQQAGSEEDAALVTYTPTGDTHTHEAALSVGQAWGDYHQVTKVDTIDTRYPLEVHTGKQNPNDPEEGTAVLVIKPDAYEPMQAPSFLANTSDIRSIKAGKDTVIFCDNPITPYGMFFSVDNKLEGLRVQDDISGDDPNLGGQLTELLGSVEFESKAPSKGNIKLWFMYHQNGAYIPTGYVTGTDGNPLIVEKSFNAGDDLSMIIAGAYYAKGEETITLHVEHSFSSEQLTMVPEKTMLCVNQFEQGASSSLARIEFMRRLGTQITPVIYKFTKPFVRLSDTVLNLNKPESAVGAGEGEEFLAQFGINNLTACKASITNGVISISDNNLDILDFYMDYLVDNTRTSMMRGKEFKASVRCSSIDTAYNLSLFAWTGKADEMTKIYSGRNNDALTLNDGWKEVKKTFIAEQSNGSDGNYDLTVTIPEEASNLAFVIYPTAAQNPINFTISEFSIEPANEFSGYTELESYNLHEVHLRESDDFIEFGQNSEGFASLRYTLNYKPVQGLPLPVGIPLKGNAPFTLDPSKNTVAGSSAKGGEGALKATKDGQVSLSCDYLLWNEKDTDSVVTLWWELETIDGTTSKITGSEIEFTVPKNSTTHGILKTQPAFVFEVEAGQWFYLRGSANKPDGAYLQSTKLTDYMVRPVIDFKELSGSYDDSDLVSIGLDKKLVVDRRVHTFTNNTSQNIVISGLNIPSDVTLASVTAEKDLPNGFTSIETVQHAYNPTTSELTVHVGSVNSGKIFLEFWG